MSTPNFTLKDIIDEKILSQRKVFLWGQVDDQSAKHVIDRLLYLEQLDPGIRACILARARGGFIPGEPLRLVLELQDGELRLYRAVGCDKCNKTGYKGRVGLHELLVADDEIKRLIQERARVATRFVDRKYEPADELFFEVDGAPPSPSHP